MYRKLLLVLIIPLIILIYKPLNIDFNQAIIISSLLTTTVSWVLGIPNKIVSSVFLLMMFILFGNTPIDKVLFFPLSDNFLLIVFSFIFSQGIINSNLAKKLFLPFINKYSRNLLQFFITLVISIIILVFTIPQPYSRVILISLVYQEYFNNIKLDESIKEVLMFSIFAFNIIVHIFFKRGDIVLNNGILAVANVEMSELQWIKNLMIPGVAMLIIAILFFVFAFRKELALFKPGEIKDLEIALSRQDKINLALILIVIVAWATESVHNLSSAFVLVIGTFLMFIRKIITFKDLKSVNVETLFYLTAAFSIGTVMTNSGVAEKLFAPFIDFLPRNFNFKFILIIMLSSMILRLFLGSSVTTMSVAIPSFITIAGDTINSGVIMFLVFISIVTFYLLPFHNSLLAVGEGNYFSNKVVLRYGIFCIIITFISMFLFFIPWWKFVGWM